MPLPIETLLRGFPSPVPTQTTSGLAWLMARAPIEATGWSSKTGVQVSPPLTDFQTPPVAVPVQRMSGFAFTTSMAAMRPLIVAGPIDRARSPARRSGSTAAAESIAGTSRSASAADLRARYMDSPLKLRTDRDDIATLHSAA